MSIRSLCGCLVIVWLAGCGTPSLLITPVSNTSVLKEVTVVEGKGWSGPKVAVIEVEGMLANARSGGFLQPTENALSLFTQQLERAEKDPRVKAVVLRINSPGGTVTASDTMYQQVVRFRQKTGKTVVASAQEVCASGAYYVACAADRIVVHPTSVVGSIGVIFQTFDISGTMAKIGVRSEAVKAGTYKEMGSPFKPIEPAERALMQAMVDEYYVRFRGVVAASRHLDEAVLKNVADGRVLSGHQAVAAGLADSEGLLDDAIAAARTKAGLPADTAVIMYKRPYGYSGSIYAAGPQQPAGARSLRVEVNGGDFLPTGFYYLWEPGL